MKLHNDKLEFSILRAICDNKKISATILPRLTEKLFHDDAALAVYGRVLANLRAQGNIPKFSTLIEDPIIPEDARKKLRKWNDKKVKSQIDKASVDIQVKNLTDFMKMRHSWGLVNMMAEGLRSDQVDIDFLLNSAADAISDMRAGASESKMWFVGGKENNIDEILHDIVWGEGVPGIPTTFQAWDKHNHKLPNSACMLIASSTGGGKSILASSWCRRLARMGYRPALLPLEMSAKEMISRMMAAEGRVPVHKVLAGKGALSKDEIERLRKGWKRFNDDCISSGGTYMIHEVAEAPRIEEAMWALKPYAPSVNLIDYIALLEGMDSEDDWRQMGNAVKAGKNFSRANHIPNVFFAQLEDGKNKLRYAQRMADHADLTWFWQGDQRAKDTGIIEVDSTKKSRNLKPIVFSLKMEWEFTNVTDLRKGEGYESQEKNKKKKEKKSPVKMKDLGSGMKF